ncbi:aminoglycoside phosphotransferase family protein [uncultured Serinicoccus sp.]|uniref:aminoglycoside phosphotransferase family protein n=1 Tax=uncultured Serinicoccus sp. TaxID=735514 RepID=UPI00262CF20A|nr:aminoglycoside phosphotransferase family protein [uncultured Serinicoccus sp.]
MSGFGVRTPWEDLPAPVHDWAARVLGGPVVEAVSQPAGFSPGSADRVRTAEGRRAFVKAVGSRPNPDSPDLHRREARVLRSLAAEGLDLAPALVAHLDDDGWVAVMTEEVEGRHPHAPWTGAELEGTLTALTELARHRAPASWPDLSEELSAEFGSWTRLRDDPPADLDPWLGARLAELHSLSSRTLGRLSGDTVVHTDVRADNLLVGTDGRVRLVDWPWASRGAAWFDASSLLVDVWAVGEVDLGPHLPAILALGATREDVLGVVVGLAGFLLDASRRPAAPGLPTLRAFQRSRGEAAVAVARELWDVTRS